MKQVPGTKSRRLSAAFPLICLLPCLALAAGWARSGRVRDGFAWGVAGTRGHEVDSVAGAVQFVDWDSTAPAPRPPLEWPNPAPVPAGSTWHWVWGSEPGDRSALGFALLHRRIALFARGAYSGPSPPRPLGYTTARAVVIPYWAPTAAVVAFALLWATQPVRRARAVRRRQLGRCIHCGYDLRGAGARCPECGAPTGRIVPGPPDPA